MSGEVLSVERLSAGYDGATIVRTVSMSLVEGEVVSLLGRNGAGKSTLVRALMGLLPRSGSVSLRGQEISRWRGNRISRAGMVCVPQGLGVVEGLSVVDHFRLAGAGLDAQNELRSAAQMFPILGERADQDAATLSGGERKMLGLALALSSQPSVILMDEPTEGVAPVVVDQIVDVLKSIETSAAILLVEQNLDAAMAASERAYVMETGYIVEEGSLEELSNTGVLEARLAI